LLAFSREKAQATEKASKRALSCLRNLIFQLYPLGVISSFSERINKKPFCFRNSLDSTNAFALTGKDKPQNLVLNPNAYFSEQKTNNSCSILCDGRVFYSQFLLKFYGAQMREEGLQSYDLTIPQG
jgi:hypothetical protein